jgi:hypothetical protein
MEVNVVVLHTTEAAPCRPTAAGAAREPTAVPTSGAAAALVPALRHRRGRLRNPPAASTNTLNVCQIELVGTDPPDTGLGQRPSLWPQAPDWALAGSPRSGIDACRARRAAVGPGRWPPYPSSYGSTSTRMTGSQWTGFEGVCGHLHVPENLHGDPGSIDFPKLIALAKGGTIEEDQCRSLKPDREERQEGGTHLDATTAGRTGRSSQSRRRLDSYTRTPTRPHPPDSGRPRNPQPVT